MKKIILVLGVVVLLFIGVPFANYAFADLVPQMMRVWVANWPVLQDVKISNQPIEIREHTEVAVFFENQPYSEGMVSPIIDASGYEYVYFNANGSSIHYGYDLLIEASLDGDVWYTYGSIGVNEIRSYDNGNRYYRVKMPPGGEQGWDIWTIKAFFR